MGSGLYRLFLASLVVAEHTGYARFGTYGGFAVYSFFIISGYWIATIRRDKPLPYVSFLLSRVWRLLPPFLLTAIVATVALGRYDLANFRFFEAAYWPNPLLPQTWSLSYEVQFYCLAPILIGAFAAPWLWLATSIVALLYLFAGTTFLGVACLAFFLLGATAATFRLRPSRSLALAAGGAGISFAVFAVATLPLPTIVTLGRWDVGYHFLFNASLALIVAPFTLWTVTLKSNNIDRALGDMSYLLYLVHLPILMTNHGRILQLVACAVATVVLWRVMALSENLRKSFFTSAARRSPPRGAPVEIVTCESRPASKLQHRRCQGR